MNPISFQDVSFSYDEAQVFSGLTLEVPPGVTSLAGPNGAGKTTFLLLSGGRLIPESGRVLLAGESTVGLDDLEKNRLCSLVYQNMEFEAEEPLGDLLDFVLANGFLTKDERSLLKTVTRHFELNSLLGRKTQNLSKGEMQRAVMAFSLIYGSQVVVMDEPVFALEDHQKKSALGFISEYARDSGRSFLYSAHELELTKDYSDQVLLFTKDKTPVLGTAAELLTRESLEAAYQVPYALLHQKERLHRETLLTSPTPRG